MRLGRPSALKGVFDTGEDCSGGGSYAADMKGESGIVVEELAEAFGVGESSLVGLVRTSMARLTSRAFLIEAQGVEHSEKLRQGGHVESPTSCDLEMVYSTRLNLLNDKTLSCETRPLISTKSFPSISRFKYSSERA